MKPRPAGAGDQEMESQCGSRKISGDPSVSVECRVGATPHIANLPAQLTFSLFLMSTRLASNEARVSSQTPNQTIRGRINRWCLLLQIERQCFSMDQSHTWRSRPATDWRQAASLLLHVHFDGSSVSRCSNQSVDLLLAEANRPS